MRPSSGNRRPLSGHVSALALPAILWLVSPAAPAADFVRDKILKPGANDVNAIAFSPDAKVLATAHKQKVIKLWSVEDGSELATLKGHAMAVKAVAFAPNGGMLASGGNDDKIKIWSVPDGKEIRTLDAGNNVLCLAFSRDGSLLASGIEGKTITLWSLPVGRRARNSGAIPATFSRWPSLPTGRSW
jgi:WD40 repeat protein